MKKALGHLTVALVFGAIWPFMAGSPDAGAAGGRFQWLLAVLHQMLSPDRDLATIVLLAVLVAAQYLAVASLAALLRPLGRAVVDGVSARLARKLWRRVNWAGCPST